ncbi:L-2-amino-thiazoline-4-carboxylic acid hydrolase [Merdimonas faecis]|uniref:L-2-amino-thiazoline-4-carboxylic acid hydrolase n=1 Tax=Merdimonas faecis TaxID=1653435 RepID=UPI0038BDE3E0
MCRLEHIISATSFQKLLRKMCSLSVRMEFGDPGWKMEWKRNDCNGIEWNCHECFYVDRLKYYGVPELVSIFCESTVCFYLSTRISCL